jgi:hypothetical protein
MFVKPDGDWSVHKPIGDVMDAAKNQCDSGLRPYMLKRDDKVIRRGSRAFVLRGLRKALENGEVGPTFRLRGHGELLFTCREATASVHVIDTNGNDKADKAWSWGKTEHPDCSFLGAYVCKRIAGTSTMSQHSYGNAVDFGRDTMAKLWDLAHFLVSKADELDLAHVIVDDMIWTPQGAWGHYSGDRHYHVHVDCLPQYSGSCGVRG